MKKTEETVRALISDLTCDDVIKCQNARRQLVAKGEAAVEPLEKALDHAKHWVHWEAAKALSQIGSPSATRVLIEALEHKEFELRWLAAEGLISIGRPAVRPLLIELITKPQSTWLHEGAHHVLSDIKDERLRAITRPVVKAIEGPVPSADIPVAAQKALDEFPER
jgi:HEAT repeat protein